MKKYINRYSVCAAMFIVVIAITSVGTVIKNLSPLKSALIDTKGVSEKIKATEKVYNEALWGFDKYITFWGISQITSGATLYDDAAYGFIIKDTHGKFHFPVGKNDLTLPIDETVKFARKLEEKGVPFVYVQAPNKKLEGYTVYPKGAYNYSNEDADEFLSEIKKNNINTLDLRELIKQQNLERESLFYKTDHHWTTPTAFWAYTELVGYLNENFTLNIDADNYYRNKENYEFIEFENCFLGSQGRRVGSVVSGYDDYTFIKPEFEAVYNIYDGLKEPQQLLFSGSFNDCIVKDKILYSKDKSANKHAAYFEWDYGDLIIENKTCKNDLKILLIKDSFSLPLAAFLSTDVKELHMVDLREKALIPYDYIDKHDFDAVVMLYNTEVFNVPMFNLTQIYN